MKIVICLSPLTPLPDVRCPLNIAYIEKLCNSKMAAFFSRVGQNGRQLYRMSACLRAWRVSRSATLEVMKC